MEQTEKPVSWHRKIKHHPTNTVQSGVICTECEATWLSTLLPISLLNWFLFHLILLCHVAALMHPSQTERTVGVGNKFRVDCISMPTPFFYHRKSFRTLPGPGFRWHICLLKGLYTRWELPKFNQNKLSQNLEWFPAQFLIDISSRALN